MSFLTALPRERYDSQAFKEFDLAKTDFDLGNAYAMAWMCQLSYETEDLEKIASVAKDWDLELVDGSIISEESATALPKSSTHLIVCRRRGATIIAFAGTDPISLANWITDFDLKKTSTGAARGFAVAAQSVWPRIEKMLKSFSQVGPIYVTGHSLGASLAAVTASTIEVAFSKTVRAVYTFGMPRTGDQTFAKTYNSTPTENDTTLGKQTVRLVHGEDLVPTVPPSDLDVCHVGLLLRCARLSKFEKNDLAKSTNSDEPSFIEGVSRELRDLSGDSSSALDRLRLAAQLLTGVNPRGLRTDPGGIAIEMLPPRLRDHMPDRYIAASKP